MLLQVQHFSLKNCFSHSTFYNLCQTYSLQARCIPRSNVYGPLWCLPASQEATAQVATSVLTEISFEHICNASQQGEQDVAVAKGEGTHMHMEREGKPNRGGGGRDQFSETLLKNSLDKKEKLLAPTR